MGLDCFILGHPDKGGRIGSYSGVHQLREILLTAAIKHVDQNFYHLAYGDPKNGLVDFETKKKVVDQMIEDEETWSERMSEWHDNQDDIYYFHQARKILNKWYQPDSTNKPKITGNMTPGGNMMAMLMEMMSGVSAIKINEMGDLTSYENMPIVAIGLSGVYKFCNHSDCEGQFTPGDCLDICNSMNLVLNSISDEDEQEWMRTIEDYFRTAYELGKPLIFS